MNVAAVAGDLVLFFDGDVFADGVFLGSLADPTFAIPETYPAGDRRAIENAWRDLVDDWFDEDAEVCATYRQLSGL